MRMYIIDIKEKIGDIQVENLGLCNIGILKGDYEF
jgi:hypothetical protein